LEENVAIIFGMGFYIVFNFIGQKFFVFKEEKKER
jgi:putative flippase GtrA